MMVSVIIPTYNRAEKLRQCLLSLTQQTFQDFEVIVCDDGSIDNTGDVITDFMTRLNLVYDYALNFGGPAGPRNRGIGLSKGKYIAFLDSDDWWYPTKLQISLQYMGEFDVVYHDLDKFYGINRSKGTVKGRLLKGDEIAKDLIINGNGLPNSSVLVRKTIIDAVGDITEDKNLIAVEDTDYWIRIAAVTSRFKYLPLSLGAYWVGDNISVSEHHIARESNLYNKHRHLLNSQENSAALMLLSLRKARVNHKLGKFDVAKKDYLISLGLTNTSLKFKSFVGIITCVLKIKI